MLRAASARHGARRAFRAAAGESREGCDGEPRAARIKR
jgi:hypothetical protein